MADLVGARLTAGISRPRDVEGYLFFYYGKTFQKIKREMAKEMLCRTFSTDESPASGEVLSETERDGRFRGHPSCAPTRKSLRSRPRRALGDFQTTILIRPLPFQRRRQQPQPQAMRRNATRNSSAPTGKMAAIRIPDPRAMAKIPRRYPPPFQRNIPFTPPSSASVYPAGQGVGTDCRKFSPGEGKPRRDPPRRGFPSKCQSWFQLCQTFCTSSLSSRKSMSFCIFLRSPSSVRVTKVWGTISIWALAKV